MAPCELTVKYYTDGQRQIRWFYYKYDNSKCLDWTIIGRCRAGRGQIVQLQLSHYIQLVIDTMHSRAKCFSMVPCLLKNIILTDHIE